MVQITDLLERNKEIAKTHVPFPYLPEAAAQGFPKANVLVHPQFRNQQNANKMISRVQLDAVCIRNVCGHVTPNITDILGAHFLIGFTQIMIVHHTDCGATYFTDDDIRRALKARQSLSGVGVGVEDAAVIDAMGFGAIGKDIGKSVRDDVEILVGNPLFPREEVEVRGFVFDIKTGVLMEA
ncbi:MAG: hypothetical protein MMC33_007998 [Icmadophila ericetorum]|nr:hypothetical protein [Icmadophila ericetorum]